MKPQNSVKWHAMTYTMVGLFAIAPLSSFAAEEASSSNPIGRVARIINPELVRVEDRLDWLETRLRGLSTFSPQPLKEAHGWRCSQVADEGPPCLTLDLGDTYPLSDIFVVPAHPQANGGRALFPLRFQIETALTADFSDAQIIYDTRDKIHESQDSYPLRISARDVDARYVRMHVMLGHFRGKTATAAISELFVISGGEPVSFNASATANGSFNQRGFWNPAYVIDGRTPLGVWQGAEWINSRGEITQVTDQDETAEWIIDLGESVPVDRINLYPYQMPELGGGAALPSDVSVHLTDDLERDLQRTVHTAKGGESFTSLTFPMRRETGRYVVVRSESSLPIGRIRHQMLSEVEVWSFGRNIALGQEVQFRHSDQHLIASPEITDGYASGLKLIPVGDWLRQLTERKEIETELEKLHPLRQSMVSETELNATWGASVAIGLTFLIPVAFIERRRLVSKKHVDVLRKRIASDLHDDIGSNLGSISLIARSAKKDLKRLDGPDELAEDLDEVEVIARESSLAMRDIVWLLERRQDTIGDFVQRMRDCASRLLRDMDHKISCRSNRTASKMTLDAKRHLFLFYKEALHNVYKHSKASSTQIQVYDSGDSLVMEIEDNGVGLPTGENERPAAVRKLTDRAAVLEGRLQVDSQPGQGTRLRLTVKRHNLFAVKAAT